jgi:hypothetical protein
VPRDLPGRIDQPERPDGSRADLARRLDRLSACHPSSPRYLSVDARSARDDATESPPEGGAPADGVFARARLDLGDRRLPAAERPEWQEPLASGAVDRVGLGVVDERASRFQPRERQLADYLASEGRAVVAIHDGYGREGRKPDAAVDEVWSEFKSLDPGRATRR